MRVGGWDDDLVTAEDYMLWLKLSQVGDFAVSSQVLFRYRQHEETISSGGKLFFGLRAFKATFRHNFPALARSTREDKVLSGFVLAHGTDALWHLRRLLVEGRIRETLSLMPQFLRGMAVAMGSRRCAFAFGKALYRTTLATIPGIARGAMRRLTTM